MTTRVLLMLGADLESAASSGIRTYVRDYVKYSPDDFEIAIVGSSSDPKARPVGVWRSVTYGRRQARFLPLVHLPPDGGARVPDLVRFVGALALRSRRLPADDHVLQFHRPALALAFMRRRGPMIQWVHLNPAEFAAHSRWRRVPWLLDYVERLTVPRMAYLLTPGADVAELYRRRFPAMAERVSFLPNWFDPERFRVPSPEERAMARTRAGALIDRSIGSELPLILFVGRLHPQKDPGLLLDAFAGFASRREARLLMVGDGLQRGAIVRQAEATGLADRVHLVGPRAADEVASLMQAADAMLIASHAEVSSRVALEALACGLPVVSTPVGEMPRVVEHGRTGWLVADRRPESLAMGLEWALDQPRWELAAAASLSVADYVPARVLAPVYELHRQLSDRLATGN